MMPIANIWAEETQVGFRVPDLGGHRRTTRKEEGGGNRRSHHGLGES